MAVPSDMGLDSRVMLLRRLRCVAFAALGAGATEDELAEAVQVAVLADGVRRGQPATCPRPVLRLVT